MEMGDCTQKVEKIRNIGEREPHDVTMLREHLLILEHQWDRFGAIFVLALGFCFLHRDGSPALGFDKQREMPHIFGGHHSSHLSCLRG